jgi:uncharacterized OB-fold protein
MSVVLNESRCGKCGKFYTPPVVVEGGQVCPKCAATIALERV